MDDNVNYIVITMTYPDCAYLNLPSNTIRRASLGNLTLENGGTNASAVKIARKYLVLSWLRLAFVRQFFVGSTMRGMEARHITALLSGKLVPRPQIER